jgi:predicted ATPase/DNA-binding winged helix-turn-helix (wHTH) protein
VSTVHKPLLSFGTFELDAEHRTLTRDSVDVPLGCRAMDLLLVLASRPGVTIGSDELTRLLWPNTFVEESNLRVHIAAVRKAMRDAGHTGDIIENVPGTGYRFALALVSRERRNTPGHAPSFRPPPVLTRLIGRTDTVRDLVQDLSRHRLMTIVGTAGIGKTSLALEVSHARQESFATGVCFVDLTSTADDVDISWALASALHLPPTRENVSEQVQDFLSDKHLLLVLDNCERHLDVTASLAESILRSSPKVSILATSREALGATGEWLRRLKPLDAPPAGAPELPAHEALAFSAVQLFVERAYATSSSFVFTDQESPWIAELCRQLDGLPLAIELAAARADVIGIRDMVGQMRESIALLSRGRRTAQPRHRTLAAALDWSYELLPEEEKILLHRLSVFQSTFRPPAAVVVTSGDLLTASAVIDGLGNLAAKSLVTIEAGQDGPLYRLLDTTRTYASEKLGRGASAEQVRRKHAEYFRDQRVADGDHRPGDERLPRNYRPLVDELRAALRWCFSPAGDPLLGIQLTITLASKWYAVTLFLDFAAEVEETLERLKSGGPLDRDTEMQLLLSFIPALYNTEGATPRMHRALERALPLTDMSLEQRPFRLRLLKELWQYHNGTGEHMRALAAANEFARLMPAGEDRTFLVQRMRAVSYLNCGNLRDALDNIAIVLEHPPQESVINRGIYEYDPQVTALFTQARALWLQGFASQARRAAERCVEAGRAAGHPASICVAFALAACPIALWCGDREAAELNLKFLREQALACPLAYWQQFGDVFERAMGLIARPDIRNAVAWRHRQLQEACVLDGGWVAEELLRQALDGERHWFSPEVLRREALRRLDFGGDCARREVLDLLSLSLDLAQDMNALAWELRTAITLASTNSATDPKGSHTLLESVVSRFSEGYDTKDYGAALTLLSELEDRLARIRHAS